MTVFGSVLTPLSSLVVDGDISYGIVQPGQPDGLGVPTLRVSDIRDGTLNTGAPMRVSPEIESRHVRTRLNGGEVLLTIVGTVGESAVVPNALAGWNVARAVAVLKPDGVPAKWLQLCLSSPLVKKQINSLLNTTVQATLNLRDLKNVLIPLPASDDIERILQVISSLDAKLALTTEIVDTADAWIRAAFDKLIDGGAEAPTISLAELFSNVRNGIHPQDLHQGDKYIGLEHIPRRNLWFSQTGMAATVTSTKLQFERGDLLFGKLRPYFHKVAVADSSGVCSTDILVLRPSSSEISGFAVAAASSDSAIAYATSNSEGTRMPRAKWADLSKYRVPWPGDAAAIDFSNRVNVLKRYVEALIVESRTLRELRTTILPEMMSGGLLVRDAYTAEALLSNALDQNLPLTNLNFSPG